MSPAPWVLAAIGLAITALPTPAQLRAGDLGRDGRLRPNAGRTYRWRPARVPVLLGGLVVPAIVLWVAGVALALAAAVVLGVVRVLVLDRIAARREQRRHKAVLTAVRVLAGELAAGARPADALRAAAATSVTADEAFGPAAAAQRDGRDPAELLAASFHTGVPALAVAWRLAASTGAALAAAVDRVALDLAEFDDRRRSTAVALAGPRSSAVLLSGLPVIGLALGAAMGAKPVDFLLGDPIGRLVCCAGVLLDAAGILWVRRIVTRAAR